MNNLINTKEHNMQISRFYKYESSKIKKLKTMIDNSVLDAGNEVLFTLKVNDGIVLARWDEDNKVGLVSYIGVVIGGIDNTTKQLPVMWFESVFELKPNGGGYQYWRKDFFHFDKAPTTRYRLAERFSELDVCSKLASPTSLISNSREGYIYVIKSDYGYKIGKTKSLKNRSQLFSVKLPFEFEIAFTFFTQDYSFLENFLHQMFKHKRINGEWFDLDAGDLSYIKKHCSAL